MNFTVESKSLLAKLLATENITIEHQPGLATAKFDIKNRVMYCPLWNAMGGDLYDLLLGHEVSHALNTPPNGWHDSVVYAGGDEKASSGEQKAFKHFLNVVEDARIERLIKRTYPGLRAPMIRAYRELVYERNFFNIKDKNPQSFFLIDKLNLLAKLGTSISITLTPQEQPYFDRMMNLETFDEVVVLTKELYAYSVKEQQERKSEQKKKEKDAEQKKKEKDAEQSADLGEQEESVSLPEDGEGDSEESVSLPEDGEGDSEESVGQGEGDEQTDSQIDDAPLEKREEDQDSTATKDFTPTSLTDDAFRNNEPSLSETTRKNYILDIPTPNLKNIVIPAAVVNESLSHYYFNRAAANALLDKFRNNNATYVNHLVKEFEMRKAAKLYNKSKVADNGDIDVNKLAFYKFEDDIFKKIRVIQKGKSHGFILLLDRSSSMRSMVMEATEQILILATFCRKVNIPFNAYTFTTLPDGKEALKQAGVITQGNGFKQFSRNDKEMELHSEPEDFLSFREILHSRMPASEFNNACANQLILAASFQRGTGEVPAQEHMGSTPLIQALIAVRELIRNFKKQHRVDFTNLIVIHDGDADVVRNQYHHDEAGRKLTRFISTYNTVVYVRDKKEHLTISASEHGMAAAVLQWVQQTTGAGVFGFYVLGAHSQKKRAIQSMYRDVNGRSFLGKHDYQIMTKIDQLNAERFLESYSPGYSRFFFIPSGDLLSTTKPEIEDDGKKWTAARLLSALKKSGVKQRVSRVLVQRFIHLIAG